MISKKKKKETKRANVAYASPRSANRLGYSGNNAHPQGRPGPRQPGANPRQAAAARTNKTSRPQPGSRPTPGQRHPVRR